MPTVASYARLRITWHGIDVQGGSGNPYSDAQTVDGGDTALPPDGVGARRAICVIDRTSAHAAADEALMHFDFMNLTGGDPDDTWTSGDYETMEDLLTTFFEAIAVVWHPGYKFSEVRWYRIGHGVPKPNPAERIFTLTSPVVGTGSTALMPPQVASTITFRVGKRRSWGRTYVPIEGASLTTDGLTLDPSVVDLLVEAADDLVTSSVDEDFHSGVLSMHDSAFYLTEAVEVDDVVDIQRRRRWQHPTYVNVIPT